MAGSTGKQVDEASFLHALGDASDGAFTSLSGFIESGGDHKGDVRPSVNPGVYTSTGPATFSKMPTDQLIEFLVNKLQTGKGKAYQAFHKSDRNQTGKIDRSDVGEVMKDWGVLLSESQMATLFARLDLDGDGEIDFTEFVNCITENSLTSIAMGINHSAEEAFKLLKIKVPEKFKHLTSAFIQYDTNRDGTLDKHELHHVCNRAGVVLNPFEMDKLVKMFMAGSTGKQVDEASFLHALS